MVGSQVQQNIDLAGEDIELNKPIEGSRGKQNDATEEVDVRWHVATISRNQRESSAGTGAVSFGLPAYQDREKALLLTKLTSSCMLVVIAVSFSTEIMCVMV